MYTLVPQKNENCIHFPRPFYGGVEENVFAFVADMKKAMKDNRIRTTNKVNVLLNYLGGDAKSCVEFCQNIDDAFTKLLKIFCTPQLLWKKKKEDIAEAFSKRNVWGPKESAQRRSALTKMINYLEEARVLSNQHETLKSLILSDTSFNFFYNLLPGQLKEDVDSELSLESSSDEQFEFDSLFEVLNHHLRMTVFRICRSAGKTKVSKKFDTKAAPTQSDIVHVKFKSPVKQHSCLKIPQCKKEWNMIGCVKMYHLKSIDERISFLKKMKCCIKCGEKFSRLHECKYSIMREAMCKKSHCKLPAALCKAHINDGNVSPELKKWLCKNNIKAEVIFKETSVDCLLTDLIKPDVNDEVSTIPIIKSTTALSVNSVDGIVDGRRNCRPDHEWYHANYLVNYRPRNNDDELPRKNSLDGHKVDKGAIDVMRKDEENTDAADLDDAQSNADNVDAVKLVSYGTEDSDNEMDVNATGIHCSKFTSMQVKAVVHAEPLPAMTYHSNGRNVLAENISAISNLKESNNHKSSTSGSVINAEKLSSGMTSPKVTTGKVDGHNQPVTKSKTLMTGKKIVVGRKKFIHDEMPNGDESLMRGNSLDKENHNDGLDENGARKVLRFSSHTSFEKENGLRKGDLQLDDNFLKEATPGKANEQFDTNVQE